MLLGPRYASLSFGGDNRHNRRAICYLQQDDTVFLPQSYHIRFSSSGQCTLTTFLHRAATSGRFFGTCYPRRDSSLIAPPTAGDLQSRAISGGFNMSLKLVKGTSATRAVGTTKVFITWVLTATANFSALDIRSSLPV
ncbi:hypothetical protein L1987_54545 [Smallanthus sonchifolius]|uniref:Uncharacterized protein n=1 Tax=Smallanthus sonchifolius TaxID=185202 RepID=A0ACB9E7A3_9ASTR|nr:hypothetical protein L1987_54545 [Smallanthus sonchifolius]